MSEEIDDFDLDDWEDDQCIECGEIGKECSCEELDDEELGIGIDYDDHALDEEEEDNTLKVDEEDWEDS